MTSVVEYPIHRNLVNKHIARAVLIVPDVNPKTGQKYDKQIVMVFRPGWANVNKYDLSLPGGGISIAEGDFDKVIEEYALQDPQLVLTMEQMILAGLHAAERKVLEELGVTLAVGLLHFVNVATNDTDWTTYTYVAELEEKPQLLVKPESAGTRWMSVDEILVGEPAPVMLPGHLEAARTAVKSVSKSSRE